MLPIPPPLYYVAAFVGGLLLRRATMPLTIGARPATAALGGLVLTGGVVLALAGIAGVVRQHTTIVPHQQVSALVTTGPYALSRNPMYAGLAVAYVGGALLAASWWPIATLPVALFTVRRLVIDPEERYLTGAFGQSYADYRDRVRRWL